MLNSKRTFILTPHPDDAELGCGGTIARLAESGTEVYSVIFTKDGERAEESQKAATIIGICKTLLFGLEIRALHDRRQIILDKLVELRQKFKPDLIIQPMLSDTHQDHRVVAQEGIRAFRNMNLLGYEVWNNLDSDSQLFVSLKDEHINRKVEAVKCYKSQAHKMYMSEDYVRSLAKVRGTQAGVANAEMFGVIKHVSL